MMILNEIFFLNILDSKMLRLKFYELFVIFVGVPDLFKKNLFEKNSIFEKLKNFIKNHH